MDRLHQYCRCIDGLIVSKQGEAKKRFKSRTELFIGPRLHDIMGETYDVRSDVEHLHENKHLEVFDRAARLDLVKKLELMEYIARSALVRILLGCNLWPHFANTSALQAFWAFDDRQRRALWGPAINPSDALAEFHPRVAGGRAPFVLQAGRDFERLDNDLEIVTLLSQMEKPFGAAN
jgi:hypothetical protein